MEHKDEYEEEYEYESDEDVEDSQFATCAIFMQNNRKKDGGSRSNTPTKEMVASKKAGSKATPATKRKKDSTPTKESTPGPSDTPASKKPKMDNAGNTPGSSGNNSAASNNMPSINIEGVNEEAVRRYLLRKPMTTTELLQKFVSKKTGLSGGQLVDTITQILKRLNPEKQKIKEKLYLSIKQ